MRRGTIAALAAAALVVACQPAALTDADRAAIEEEITQLYTEQSAAINAADAEAWLAFFEPGEDFLIAVHGELMDWARDGGQLPRRGSRAKPRSSSGGSRTTSRYCHEISRS